MPGCRPTDDPRNVVAKRAYSFDKPAWVVLARDDGTGKPGEVIARKKVAKKFAGDVHVDALYGNSIKEGSLDDYLVGKPGTSRRCVRGDEKIHATRRSGPRTRSPSMSVPSSPSMPRPASAA
ncbi:MAG: hypothetical protein RIT45_1889 [Pseudomonadota bacterium]|jgi:hypothetical protein